MGKMTEDGLEFTAMGPGGNEVGGIIKLEGDISTHLLLVRCGFRLVSWCAVSAHFAGFAAHCLFCLGSSEGVVFEEFGVVNGVVD